MFNQDFQFKYCPILSISPSETKALEELPNKDKDLILPVFPISSWATANKLSDAINKVESSIGKNRKWIADIDYEDLLSRPIEKYRPVHHEIKKLTISDNGYKHWCDFILEHPNAIPCLQLKDLSELQTQLNVLSSFERGIVVILKRVDIESKAYEKILPPLRETDNLLIMLDLEQITKEQIDLIESVKLYINAIKAIIPQALISLSSTSFPSNFGGQYRGCKSIYERALFDKLRVDINDLIYSDRGSARATKMSGGGGTPPPRIDYSCRNEWNFIRIELEDELVINAGEDPKEVAKNEKKKLKINGVRSD